jgi:regulatory protein
MSSIMGAAIRHLSERSISEHELRLYLEKEFASLPNLDSCIDAAFKRLQELHLINDFRLAMNIAQHYAHKGNRFISRILQQKGIEEVVITNVLLSLDNENVRALDEARKKLGGRFDNSEKTMTALHRFLSGRSFSYNTINTVMLQLGKQKRYSVN